MQLLARASVLLLFAAHGAGSQAPAARPTLVVFFTVDQMRSDYFSRLRESMG